MAVDIKHTKQVFMIGGPNGAGKTTCAHSVMPELIVCDQYINADAIAASLSPFKPGSSAIQAGKLMLNRMNELMDDGVNFAFESTMASKLFTRFLEKCRDLGYQINLLYVWLASSDLAVERVKSRVSKGGHHIPEDVIRRRYKRSMSNLVNLYIPLADRWRVIDNSDIHSTIIAEKYLKKDVISIVDDSAWALFQEDSI